MDEPVRVFSQNFRQAPKSIDIGVPPGGKALVQRKFQSHSREQTVMRPENDISYCNSVN